MRKMIKSVWQGSFSEAEERDNIFWASQTEEQRLEALVEMRNTFFADANPKIELVVYKRKKNEVAGIES